MTLLFKCGKKVLKLDVVNKLTILYTFFFSYLTERNCAFEHNNMKIYLISKLKRKSKEEKNKKISSVFK